MNKPYIGIYQCVSLILIWLLANFNIYGSDRIDIHIDRSVKGAPITMGIPFSQGSLQSPDFVRLLDKDGNEIPSQTTLVSTWEPIDYSVKWLWIFFFSTGDQDYTLEYGSEVRKGPIQGVKIKVKNAQRTGQTSYVENGNIRFSISKRGGGFIDDILYDIDDNGFDEGDTIAVSSSSRGSFLDILDDLGIDSSKAQIHHTFREKGSGPLHTIYRMEGTYTYNREDNRPSPFTIRLHLYAGKTYIKVLHTFTYTGIPDKHIPRGGQHANVALTADVLLKEDRETLDSGWMQPNDRISAIGIDLKYKLDDNIQFKSELHNGTWNSPGSSDVHNENLSANNRASLFQTGPKPDRIPPVPNSTMDERIDGFKAHLTKGNKVIQKKEKAVGWVDISDQKWGIGIGIKNFMKEYPKEIVIDQNGQEAIAYIWSPNAGPLSLARSSLRRDQGMIANMAEGITKTTELVIYFHESGVSDNDLQEVMHSFLDPPVPHAAAEVYAKSKVYGQFAPKSSSNASFERALDYKFDWQLYNADWEPWYGMLDYGDQMNYFFRDDWFRWENNEPSIDFMYWLQYMRTGESKYYHAAEAMSRHTMDVDNIHWPTDEKYYGDTNESIDYWRWEAKESTASPYLGVGRRHANQHWSAILSAHVWLQGWLASYYLTGYHRGLDIAKLTADSYIRRLWGGHGLTGRRLYLSLWNLVEAWDATKDERYLNELKDRIDMTLDLQNGPDQYDNLVIDRYGYSQIYASHAMYKYYQLTGEERVRQSLIRHARAVRDNPPYNHEYESLLASIHSLVVGYEFTGENSFIDEAFRRAEVMKTDTLTKSFKELGSQRNIAESLREVSHLPTKGDFQTRFRRDPAMRWFTNWDPTQGLRVFGWTHIYNIPWLMNWADKQKKK